MHRHRHRPSSERHARVYSPGTAARRDPRPRAVQRARFARHLGASALLAGALSIDVSAPVTGAVPATPPGPHVPHMWAFQASGTKGSVGLVGSACVVSHKADSPGRRRRPGPERCLLHHGNGLLGSPRLPLYPRPPGHDIPLGLWNGSSFSESTLQVKGFLAGISCLAENGGTWCIALGEAPTAKADNATMIGGDFLIARPGLGHGSRKPAASQAHLTARTTPRSTSLRRFYCSQPAMLGATGPRGGPGRAFCP